MYIDTYIYIFHIYMYVWIHVTCCPHFSPQLQTTLVCITLQGSRALEQLDGNKLKGKLLTPDKFLWLYKFTGRMPWRPQAVTRSTCWTVGVSGVSVFLEWRVIVRSGWWITFTGVGFANLSLIKLTIIQKPRCIEQVASLRQGLQEFAGSSD